MTKFWQGKPPRGTTIPTTGATPMIEALETRRLFAAVTLQKGILKIVGTDDPDDVAVAQSRQVETDKSGNVFFVNHLSVTVDGEFFGDFSYNEIKKVVV